MKKTLIWRGIAGVCAFLMAFMIFGSSLAYSYEPRINTFLGVTPTRVVNDESITDTMFFPSTYGEFTSENLTRLEADVYDHIAREEEEGAVLLENKNDTLPLSSGSKISLFGLAAKYPLYHTSSAGSRTYRLEIGRASCRERV
mgnify:FL=1